MDNVTLTYDEFAAAYSAAFAKMASYELSQVGCDVYLDEMVKLADAYPEFLVAFEEAN